MNESLVLHGLRGLRVGWWFVVVCGLDHLESWASAFFKSGGFFYVAAPNKNNPWVREAQRPQYSSSREALPGTNSPTKHAYYGHEFLTTITTTITTIIIRIVSSK